MAGAFIELDLSGFKLAQDKINLILDFDRHQLLQLMGALGESQTRRRISEEKTSPDGTPWPEWSESYAATVSPGQSLLEASGGLLDSITHNVDADLVEWGSNKEYARIHQEGGTTKPHVIRARYKKALAFGGQGNHPVKQVNHPGSVIPARKFLGVSEENKSELQAEALQFFAHLLQ